MRPYEELCRVSNIIDLRLVKSLLKKHDIEFFVQGDPFNLMLLHIKDAMRVMVREDELFKAKDLMAREN